MQTRNAIGALFAAAILLFSLAGLSADESVWYGGKAIGAEASGFDALALEIFGGASPIAPDETIAASQPLPASLQSVVLK
jgi:hypothetical protein